MFKVKVIPTKEALPGLSSRVSLINNIEWLSPMKLINYLKQKDFPATIAGCELHQSEKFIADAMKIILTEEEIKTLDVLDC